MYNFTGLSLTMSKKRNIILAVFLVLAASLVLGPFLIPIPPLKDTVPPEELADSDSKFVEVNGLNVHYKESGDGGPAIILLHGFLASIFSWREVMEPLSEYSRVVAFDRPAFGLTERPLEWEVENPYSRDSQVELVIGLMDQLGIDQAVLVGNSAGGTVSMSTALKYPQRVKALILVDPAVYEGGGSPGWSRIFMKLPQIKRLGPLLIRNVTQWGRRFGESAWHDPSKFTPDIWEGYTKALRAENWDRALWEFTLASSDSQLAERLAEIEMPVLVITGDDDRIVPTEESIRLAGEIKDAELEVLKDCGHVPQEECPEAFLDAVVEFMINLP